MSRRLVTVDPGTIIVPERLRPVDSDWVAEIAASIAARGQIEPITIRPSGEDLILVAGAHRHAACDLLGRPVDAVVDEMDELAARLAEIDENLIRRELSAIDRAVFLAERKAIWDELHPERRGRPAKGKEKTAMSAVFSFASEAAARTGLSQRTIWGAVSLAKAFSAAEIDLIRRSALADNAAELEKLRKATPDARRIFFAALREDPKARIGKVISAKAETDPTAAMHRLLDGFNRLNDRQKRAFLQAALQVDEAEARALVDSAARPKRRGAQ